jgi:hydroxymethylpyrimidine/phosphomethylpyrimidine kinase
MEKPLIDRSVLTIAGSDSCGGSGIQADLNTFAAFGVYGASVITAVAARNTVEVKAVEPVSHGMIVSQVESVMDDLPIAAIKIGALPSVAGITVLGEHLAGLRPRVPMVVDPVVIEPKGKELSGEFILEALQNHLFPLATLITPNLAEARILTGMKIETVQEMESAARQLLRFGSEAVLLKGGTFNGSEITDLLVTGEKTERYTHRTFPGLFHGTGCALSSAVAAQLAMDVSLPRAVDIAIAYVQECLASSRAPVKGHAGLLGYCPRN